jgi:aubergine-like protein
MNKKFKMLMSFAIFHGYLKFTLECSQTFRATRYNTIKAITCVENAVPSQVVTVKTLTKKQGAGGSMLMSVCTKLVMQMNCKMGGALWRVKIPLTDTVIMGYDTFHDTVNKKKFVAICIWNSNSV